MAEVKANVDAVSLMFDQSLSEKQLTKKNYKVAINILISKINEMKSKQSDIENNTNLMISHNTELMNQNEFIIKELNSTMYIVYLICLIFYLL